MKADPILEEVWRIKDKISREMAADPDAYFAKLDAITKTEEKAGRRIIRSAAELRQLVVETELQRAQESAFQNELMSQWVSGLQKTGKIKQEIKFGNAEPVTATN